MSCLNSIDVRVFPFGSPRKNYYPLDRVLNEQNLSKIIRNITDKVGFVISYNSDTNFIEFMLYGYYFEVNLTPFIQSNSDSISKSSGITAYIVISGLDNRYEYLLGNDDNDDGNDVFTGLFLNEEPDPSNKQSKICSLKLLDENLNVPNESRYKFDLKSIPTISDSLEIKKIYCGNATINVDNVDED